MYRVKRQNRYSAQSKEMFLELCRVYHKVRLDMSSDESKSVFLCLSLQIHGAKATVPKAYWKYASVAWYDKNAFCRE